MKKIGKKRVLILSAPFGFGHIRAAEAICKAYREKYIGQIKHVDFITYSNPFFSYWMQKVYYFATDHTPEVYKLAYKIEDKSLTPVKRLEGFLNTKKYSELVKKYKPDLIISTNFLPAAVVSRMYQRFKIPNAVVLTDFVSHRLWVYRNNQLFFVAHQGMVEELMKLGVDRSKICVSGIPTSSDFLKKFDRNKLRRKLNLSNKPVILFMVWCSNIDLLTEMMESLVRIRNDFQIIMITGRNRVVFKELKRQFSFSKLDGKVLGFVNNVNEYMAAADLMLSKAGGLTVTEALIVGLPMVIVRPTPGQEDGNTKFLTEAGAAIYTKEIKDVTMIIDDLLVSPKKLKQMAKNAKKLALPNAAEVILEESMKLK